MTKIEILCEVIYGSSFQSEIFLKHVLHVLKRDITFGNLTSVYNRLGLYSSEIGDFCETTDKYVVFRPTCNLGRQREDDFEYIFHFENSKLLFRVIFCSSYFLCLCIWICLFGVIKTSIVFC